jgi:pyrroloquinoline-quinone synthase
MTTTLAPSRLATPPRAPIPALDRPLTPAELEEALRSFHGSYYVQHPFHQLMYAGKLSQRQFQGWVANRLAYQRVVPRKDAAILSNCPEAEVRREWIGRIIDHDGTAPGTGGIELWIRLGVALGVPREEMEDERHVLPAVRLICESYVTFSRRAHRRSPSCSPPRSISSASRPSRRTIPGSLPRRWTTSRAGWCRRRAT